MKHNFVSKTPGARRLIAIFAGWSMDANPFRGLAMEGLDIVVFYDYTDGDTGCYAEIRRDYQETAVIAWSYGVAIADPLIDGTESTAIAVNGTTSPVDDRLGIPRHVFAITERRFTPAGLQLFYKNVFGSDLSDCPDRIPSRSFESQKEELHAMGLTRCHPHSPFWRKVYISDSDRIFPFENMKNAWAGTEQIIMTGVPHCPDFSMIIRREIIDKNLIARRFSENVDGYRAHADVQAQVADRLIELYDESGITVGPRVFEAGIGTGFLTRRYMKGNNISADSVAVDLADADILKSSLERDGIHFPGRIICGDAEHEIATLPDGCMDTVASSSAIQWFCNLRRFLGNTARVLRPGGTALISTYGPGTFDELKKAAGGSLDYVSAEKLRSMIPDDLEVITMTTEEITVSFNSGRELLRYISDTGLNAVSRPKSYADTRRLISALDSDPRLTYIPVYLIMKKRSEL